MSAGPCPACGSPVPDGARFCPSCGRPIQDSGLDAERRVVTVVFADLEGFTALSEGRDPESVKELLDACFGALVPVVTAHGGHVDKIIGDELMAVFGAPSAHEDDAERAVRAALALPAALASVAPDLRLRVGVNTGEVLAGAVGPGHAYTVTGDAVNVAHRLVSVADPGEVLVGERTHQATEHAVIYAGRGAYELKGKAEPVLAWAALDVPEAPGRRGGEAVSVPLVGRQRDLAELVAAVRRATTEGPAAFVAVIGEPGVGKTRLALELVIGPTGLGDEVTWRWATCPPYGPGDGLAPVVDLVRATLGVDGHRSAPEQVDAVRVALEPLAAAAGTDLGVLLARTAQLLGLQDQPSRSVEADPGPSRGRAVDHLLAAARTILLTSARTRPLLLVVDDVQWADDRVLAFLQHLAEGAPEVPLAVVALARDELLERRAGVGSASGLTLVLRPLTTDASAALVETLLDAERPAPEGARAPASIGPGAADRIVQAAGGNPLLLEQLVHYLVETRTLVLVDDTWHAAVDLDEAGLPDGVRSLIAARLDALPAVERDALQHAAVAGRRFRKDVVASLAGLDDAGPVLAALVDRGLITPIPDEGHGDHAFRHVLTRDVAYAALPLGERATRHARVAAWLAAHVDPEGPEVADLAHHYERAVVLSREIDHTDPGLSGAAFAALVAAARRSVRYDANRAADHWYRRARDLGSTDRRAGLEVALEHGGVLLRLRRLDDARATFEDVHRRSAAADPDLAARAEALLGAVARLSGDVDRARDHFTTAHERWRALDDRRGEAETLRLEGWSELTAGRARAAVPRLEHALALQDGLGDDALRAETLQHLAWCEFALGEVAAARQHLWDAMVASLAADDVGGLGWCLGLLGFTFLQTGQVGQALELADNLLEQTRREGDPWGEWTCVVLRAATVAAQGDIDEADALATQAHRHFVELDDPWGLVMSQLVRGIADRARGRHDDARTLLAEALGVRDSVPFPTEEARLLTELARVELDAGRDDEAARRARAVLALVRGGLGDRDSGIRALTVLAAVEVRRGDPGAAQLLLEEAIEPTSDADRSDAWRQAVAALAELHVAGGHLDQAAELLARTRDPATEASRPRAVVARAAAELAEARGEAEAAEASWAEARAALAGAPYLLAQLDAPRRPGDLGAVAS